MNRYKLTIAYNGSGFSGYQQQPSQRTVESTVKAALNALYKNIENLTASGRTDSGVHAIGQVVHFDASLSIPTEGALKRLKTLLPVDIQALSLELERHDFNARFSAVEREYHYLFSDMDIPFHLTSYISPVFFEIPENYIEKAEQYASVLTGTHDFANYRNLGSSEKTTMRTIHSITLTCQNETDLYGRPFRYYRFSVKAQSFMYRMVRHIVGVFFAFLKQKITLADIKKSIESQEYKLTYMLAPAKGLTLVKVKYGELT